MKITLIQVPYHLQHKGQGMGAGPGRLIDAGAAQLLADQGHEVIVERVTLDVQATSAAEGIVEVDGRLADEVREAVDEGSFPLVLAGNCNTVLGTLAGLRDGGLGIIWFDAHGDWNTPETSPSGFLDGMALAIANGKTHEDFRHKIGLKQPVAEEATLLFGVRDLDPGEAKLLEQSSVQVVEASEARQDGLTQALQPWLDKLRGEATGIYLHLDLDVLDPAEAVINEYSTVPGGLTVGQLAEAVQIIARQFNVRAATISAYNPSSDSDGKGLDAALRMLTTVANAVAGARAD